jgi:pimeloyl-ACP methyl ester carboxylesterase
MKKIIYTFLLLTAVVHFGKAQLVSYTLQQSFTEQQLDSFLNTTGFSLPVSPQYDIDVYQVIYKTPYKNIDSLVNVSGIVVFPKNASCPSALGCYAHGTFSGRLQVPSYEGPERPIGLFFAGIGGIVTAMPDELGLGDSDSILIHPYVNAFHSGHASVNIMRAARQLADTLGIALNGQVMLTGYSQGGYTTMATHKLIQENYASEFNVVASAPMSGPYDLKVTMVDVMLSTAPFAAPSYLPYLLLGYHSVYPSLQQLYPTPSDIFKSPYDTIIPPLFYSKNYSTGYIDQFCNAVPRNMIIDSVIDAFANNLQHPLRLILAENDLLGWAPRLR